MRLGCTACLCKFEKVLVGCEACEMDLSKIVQGPFKLYCERTGTKQLISDITEQRDGHLNSFWGQRV